MSVADHARSQTILAKAECWKQPELEDPMQNVGDPAVDLDTAMTMVPAA